MKKVLVIGFALLFLLTGCGETQPNTAVDDPLLAKLSEAVETADMNYARVDADHSMYTDPQSVRVTKDLLKGIGEALLSGNPNLLEPGLPSVSASGESQTVMIQFPFGEDGHMIIQLFDHTDQQPDQTVMWMQLDEESVQYTLERTAFEEIYELIAAQTFPKEISLEGEYACYIPADIDAGGTYFRLQDVLEVNGSLLFLWGTQNDYRLHVVNPQTGESKTVWEYTAAPEADRRPGLELESSDYEGFDYRITGCGMVTYRNSQNPAISKVFEAPQRIVRSDRFSYDVHPKTGIIAYSTEDGVYAGTENNMSRILDSKDASDPSNPGEADIPEEFAPYYGAVHILDNGQRLAAEVIYPGSQSGLQAIALAEIETGKVTVFEDLFSAMIADVCYLDDRTIAAAVDPKGQAAIIDVTSGQTKHLPYDEMGSTYDFTTWVDLRQEKNDDGVPVGYVTSYRADMPDQVRQLLKVTGENAWIGEVTQNYAILICRDGLGSYVAVIPLS